MQAPTLFIIAADLTKMQVNANIDESDVGRIRPGQHGDVPRRRLPDRAVRRDRRAGPPPADGRSRTSTTYATVINVPNPELKLKPGMTANVNVEIAKRTDVAPGSERRAAVPSDARDIRSAQAHSAAWPARVGRRRAGTRWTGRTGCPRGTGGSRCSGFTRCSGCSRCAECAGGRTCSGGADCAKR